MKTILLLLCTMAGLAASADSVAYTIKVVDQNGGGALADAFVRVVDLTSGKTSVTLSNDSGYVALDLTVDDKYRVDIGKKVNDKNVKYITYSFFTSGQDILRKTSTQVALEKVLLNSQIVLSNIYFEPGNAELTGEAKLALANTLIALHNSPTLQVEIGVHADCNEAEEVSAKRATAIKEYFANKGDMASRVTVKDYGKNSQLAGCNCNSPVVYPDNYYAVNRVAEFKVVGF